MTSSLAGSIPRFCRQNDCGHETVSAPLWLWICFINHQQTVGRSKTLIRVNLYHHHNHVSHSPPSTPPSESLWTIIRVIPYYHYQCQSHSVLCTTTRVTLYHHLIPTGRDQLTCRSGLIFVLPLDYRDGGDESAKLLANCNIACPHGTGPLDQTVSQGTSVSRYAKDPLCEYQSSSLLTFIRGLCDSCMQPWPGIWRECNGGQYYF